MEIKSVVGKGSTFAIVVPGVEKCKVESAKCKVGETGSGTTGTTRTDGTGDLEPASPAAPVTPVKASLRLLIADDTKMNQLVLKTMLAKLGVKDLTFADNGREALDILKDPSVKPFDIVLTDFVMPEMSGDELVKEIRADPALSSLKVYLFTADVEMKKTYAEKGFDGILLKPANLEALKNLWRNA